MRVAESKKMGKFLFITTKADWGGSEPLWCEAASKALEEGHRVTVLLPQVGKLAGPVEALASKGAKVVMRPPRARPTLLRRLEWKVRRIREPETHWWRSKFPEPFNAICVSQGGAYCVMNMPGLANWLMEIGTPFVLVGHSHRPFAMPEGELRETIRRLFDKADKVCLVAQDHVRAVGRFLGMELRNAVVVQNPVNLKEEKAKTDLTMKGAAHRTTGRQDVGRHLGTTPRRLGGRSEDCRRQPERARREGSSESTFTNFHEREEERGTGSVERVEEAGLTTEDTECTELAGLRFASQAGASESDSLAIELADAPVSESLTRSASGPALALRAVGLGSEGENQLADSEGFLEGQSQAGLQMGKHKHQPVRAANESAASEDNSLSVLIREIRGQNSDAPANASEARMACVARFEVRDKGQDLLLEALADPVWRERDFRLDFYGSGPDREILEDLISFYRLGDKVKIVGFESNIRKIWGDHGLLVLPSLSEGTPISLIEAQLCARASLVTRVDGNPEWVEEGNTGFLAEAPTVHHLRLALERAWENRHRWAELGNAARAACLAKRDPDPAGTLLALLRKAAERG